MDRELAELRLRFETLRERLGEDGLRFGFNTSPAHDGSAHFEWANSRFALITTERGNVVDRKSSPNGEEILYHAFEAITGEIASAKAAKLGGSNADFRRNYHDIHLSLMGRLTSEWRERLSWIIADRVAQHPVVDYVGSLQQAAPAMRKRNNWALGALVLIAVALVMGAHWPLVTSFAKQQALMSNGATIRGEVIERYGTGLRFAAPYTIVYRLDGDTEPTREAVSQDIYSLHDAGDGIRVTILPDDREVRAIEGNAEFERRLVLYLIIDLMLAFAVLFNWRQIRRRANSGMSPQS